MKNLDLKTLLFIMQSVSHYKTDSMNISFAVYTVSIVITPCWVNFLKWTCHGNRQMELTDLLIQINQIDIITIWIMCTSLVNPTALSQLITLDYLENNSSRLYNKYMTQLLWNS